MPARRELTLEEYQAREERRREQTRLRVARYRARRNAQVSVTGHSNGTGAGYPPHTPPSPPLSLEREIREALEPLTARGYVHDPRFWVLASEQYPHLCLELEALKLADWLTEPRNAKRRCSKAFLDNWLKKAEADRLARAAGPPPSNGHLQAMRIDPPIAFQHNRQPPRPDDVQLPNGELVPIAKEDFQRTVDANRGLPLEQKLARLNGRLKGARG
jgi:hypothetical protein